MKRIFYLFASVSMLGMISSCDSGDKKDKQAAATGYDESFDVTAQSFADIQILRYEVPGFDQLTLKQKEFVYYLSQAGLAGRDIFYDQKSKYGLMLRKTLENMYETYSGDKNTEDWNKFQTYIARFWFSYGNHHHYGNEKFFPECSKDYFVSVAKASNPSGFPMNEGESLDDFLARVTDIIYNPNIEPKLVDFGANKDVVKASSVNFYENVTQKEVEDFYAKFNSSGEAPMWGLNSKLMKENGRLVEKVWKVGGMYSDAITKIVYWLEKAAPLAENDAQKKALELLIEYYKTGDLHTFDQYSIAWVNDTASTTDVVNGFIETYEDPLSRKASFESVVSMKDFEASRNINILAANAQWFEDNSPLMDEHKKKEVKGIIAKAITVINEAGRLSPSTAIGINLPNNEWIRKEHGSKSVSLSNIVHSYNVSSATSGMLDEFGVDDEVKERIRKWSALASDLHTEMHEVIGHASGQINPGISTPDKTLKNYASALEEARADLVALYYAIDPKLVELGVMSTVDVGKAEYDSYMMNGLMTQLTRLKPGDKLEEAHMRNRQLVAKWAYEHGKADNVVEMVKRDGKTYVKVNDYDKLRDLFGRLLREIQRVKSEGDFEGGKHLIETYGVKVDPELHKEVLERFNKLNIKPYKGFIQPKLVPVMDGDKIKDVKIEYPDNFYKQMMEYSKEYSNLPLNN
ncbi:MAG: hypothetical protein J5I50_09405 [Chitinophagaceae bacterium]|nr:hypothetical protein [Chitinophagaceae bacterium]